MTLRTVVEAMNERKALERKNQRPSSTKKQMPQTKRTVVVKRPNSKGNAPSKANGVHDMTKTEARKAIKTIKNSVCSLMEKCYQLETRNGHIALGYTSFKNCVANELVGVVEYDYAIKLKNAGQVHMVVCSEIPMGQISEGVFRPLFRFPDAMRKKLWNIAVKKCGGDFKEVKGPMLTEIIESKGLAAPAKDGKTKAKTKTSIAANGQKDVLDPKIIINKKLQSRMRASLLELLKQDNFNNKHRPASKKSFEAALNTMLDDLFDFLYGHYENIYGE